MKYTELFEDYLKKVIEKTENDEIKWQEGRNESAYYFGEKEGDINISYFCIVPDEDSWDGERENVKDLCFTIQVEYDIENDTGIDIGGNTKYYPFSEYRDTLLALYKEITLREKTLKDIKTEEDIKKFLNAV